MLRQIAEERLSLLMGEVANPDLPGPRIGLERGHGLDPLPFAHGLSKNRADEGDIEILGSVRTAGEPSLDQLVDRVPADLVEGPAPQMLSEPTDPAHIVAVRLLVGLFLQPPQCRFVPG